MTVCLLDVVASVCMSDKEKVTLPFEFYITFLKYYWHKLKQLTKDTYTAKTLPGNNFSIIQSTNENQRIVKIFWNFQFKRDLCVTLMIK